MKRHRFASNFAAITFAAISAVPQLRAADVVPSQAEVISREVSEVFRKAGDAICHIEGKDEHGRLRGTGFFVDADGTLLTSYSVGGTTQDVIITAGERRYPATRIVADARSGIAVLKIAADRPVRFLKPGKSADLATGSIVVSAGFPLDLPLSPSFGPVAGMDSGYDGRFFATRHIRANLPVQRGQGGSPVLNLRGEAVGVLISSVEENSGIFALPIEAAEKIMRDFRTHGRVRQGWVGVEVVPAPEPDHGSTARVITLREDAPAFLGGMRPGDILLQVGASKITNTEDVLSAAFFVTATEPVTMRVSRGGKEMDLTVTPLDPPDGTMPSSQMQKQKDLTGDGINLGK